MCDLSWVWKQVTSKAESKLRNVCCLQEIQYTIEEGQSVSPEMPSTIEVFMRNLFRFPLEMTVGGQTLTVPADGFMAFSSVRVTATENENEYSFPIEITSPKVQSNMTLSTLVGTFVTDEQNATPLVVNQTPTFNSEDAQPLTYCWSVKSDCDLSTAELDTCTSGIAVMCMVVQEEPCWWTVYVIASQCLYSASLTVTNNGFHAHHPKTRIELEPNIYRNPAVKAVPRP